MKPTVLIVGLGNPGKSYAETRHNLGWQALDAIADALGAKPWKLSDKFEAECAETPGGVLLMKPHTYMNLSGQSARKAMDFYKLQPDHVLALCDDIDLALGDVRFRQAGGPGTHNGMRSMVEQLGEGFARVRLGLGKDHGPMDLAAWVLSVPAAADRKILDESCKKAAALVQEWLTALESK